MKKYLLTIPLAILTGLAFAGHASAHNATATPSCGGLSWNAYNYEKTNVNTIVVKVDDQTVYQDLDFKASDTGTHPWSQTAAHIWRVVIEAPGTQYDKAFGGTWQPCITVPTSTTVVATTTVPPTTSVPDVATTVVTDTTTTVVAVDIPPVPTTVADLGVATPEPTLTPDEPVLPRTGAGMAIFALATLLIGVGVGAVRVTRRRVG